MSFRHLAVFLAAAALTPAAVYAQSSPSGRFIAGHALRANGQSGTPYSDAGGAGGSTNAGSGFLSELGIKNTGTPLCIYDDLINSANGYHQLCFGASGGLISFNAFGGASQLPLSLNLNGTLYTIPTTGAGNGNVVGPNSSSIGYLAGFNNTVGTLLTNIPSHASLNSGITLSGASFSSINSQIFGTQTVTGTATAAMDAQGPQGYVLPNNYLNCTDTVAAPAISGNPQAVDCFVVYQILGGGSSSGSRVTNASWTYVPSAMTLTADNQFIVGNQATVIASASLGGTSGGRIGSIYGYGSQLLLQSGAAYYDSAISAEFDVGVQAGATGLGNRVGVLVTVFGGAGASVQGIGADVGYWLKSGTGLEAGFKCGFCVGDPGGDAWPIDTTGTIFGTYGNTGTVQFGIDFAGGTTPVAFSAGGAALRANGTIIVSSLTNYSSSGAISVNQGGGFGALFTMTGTGAGTVNANHVQVIAVAAGGAPNLSAVGTDTDIGLVIQGKGGLGVQISGQGLEVGAPTGGYEGNGTLNTANGIWTNGVLTVDGSNNGTFQAVSLTGAFLKLVTTVTDLPTCNAGAKGKQYIVTDSAAASYLGSVGAGGGTVVTSALCNGAAWVQD